MNFYRAIFVLSVLTIVGCQTNPIKNSTYSGEYFYNFENSIFTANGSKETWCVHGDMSKAELPEKWGTSIVEIEGSLGPTGSYGSLGRCKRVITVTKLISAKSMQARK